MVLKIKTFHASERQLYTILTVYYSVSEEETDVLSWSILRETLTVSEQKIRQNLAQATTFENQSIFVSLIKIPHESVSLKIMNQSEY